MCERGESVMQIGDDHIAVLRAIRAAAYAGAPAPSDVALAEALGESTRRIASRLVKELEAAGLVRVDRRARNRRRFVFADGRATAWSYFGHDRQRRSAGKRRKCLCCGKSFMSAGPGNRLCDTCRRADNYAAEVYRVAI